MAFLLKDFQLVGFAVSAAIIGGFFGSIKTFSVYIYSVGLLIGWAIVSFFLYRKIGTLDQAMYFRITVFLVSSTAGFAVYQATRKYIIIC